MSRPVPAIRGATRIRTARPRTRRQSRSITGGVSAVEEVRSENERRIAIEATGTGTEIIEIVRTRIKNAIEIITGAAGGIATKIRTGIEIKMMTPIGTRRAEETAAAVEKTRMRKLLAAGKEEIPRVRTERRRKVADHQNVDDVEWALYHSTS